ncbi:MAG: HDIG domain-containing metalloprotein [Acidimicrobiia bacterium]
MQRPTLVRISIFLATVVASWGVLSLGTAEPESSYQAGMIAPNDFAAAKDASVVDVVATEDARQEARDSILPFKETNPETETVVLADINGVFDSVETLVVGDEAVRTPTPPPDLPEVAVPDTSAGGSTTTTQARNPGLITGRVYLDVNGDGIFNPEAEGERVDQGLAGVTVLIRTEDGPTQRRTDAAGVWSFELSTGAAVVSYDPADTEIPAGWMFASDEDAQLVECGRDEVCEASDIPIAPNLRSSDDAIAAMNAEQSLLPETIAYLVATASDDVVRAPLGEPLHLPAVREAALNKALQEFGRRIEQDQLQDVKTGVRSSPPLVFHSDTNQDAAGGAAAGEIVATFLQANFLVNQDRTTAAQDAAASEVEDVVVDYVAPQVIVSKGQVMTQLDVDAINATSINTPTEQASAALLAVVAVLVALVWLYLARFRPEFWARPRMVALLGILILLAAASVRGTTLIHESTSWYVLPAVAFGFVTAILFDQRIAVLMALSVAVLTAVGTLDIGVTVYGALAALAPIPFVSSVSSRGAFRNAIVLSSLVASLVAASTSWFFHVGPNDSLFQIVGTSVAWAFAVSVVVSLVGLAALQFFESAFDITTTLSLLDLTDRNHKALQLLQEKAFGTFNHSLMVGTLADAAARSIGADPLLARAMAYYHDLGKTENPTYFIENQFGIPNPHDTLAPQDSAEIIRRHVTDGVALAREFKIPTDVTQGIVSHHGDGVMRYFYEKAREFHGHEVNVDDFRHIGHKPRTAETAILMLADSLEASSRAVFQTEEPNPDAIEKVVNRIMDEKVEDGQLSESPLTLGELTKIRKAFLESLVGHYHQRIAYPNFPGT